MFGATILVPLLTGMNPSLALVSACLGTLVFHVCTKFKVPVFLGSSFAFLTALSAVIRTIPSADGSMLVDPSRIPLAQGGIIFAGLLYLLFALIAKLVGAEKIRRFFPPVAVSYTHLDVYKRQFRACWARRAGGGNYLSAALLSKEPSVALAIRSSSSSNLNLIVIL